MRLFKVKIIDIERGVGSLGDEPDAAPGGAQPGPASPGGDPAPGQAPAPKKAGSMADMRR